MWAVPKEFAKGGPIPAEHAEQMLRLLEQGHVHCQYGHVARVIVIEKQNKP